MKPTLLALCLVLFTQSVTTAQVKKPVCPGKAQVGTGLGESTA